MVRFAPLFMLLAATAAQAQSTEKRVLLEVYTGAWCQFCTDVDWRVDALKATWGDRLVVAYAHQGDGMAFSPGPIEEVDPYGYPLATVDRGEAQSRGDWDALVTARMALDAGASLGMLQHYDADSRTLDVEATVTFEQGAAGATQLRLELIEDGLTGTGSGWDQANNYNTTPSHAAFGLGSPIPGYVHDRVLRATPAGIDDDGAIAAGAVVDQVATERWQVVLPAGWDPANMTVATFLIDQAAAVADRRVWTVLEAPLREQAPIALDGTTGTPDAPQVDFGGVRIGQDAEVTVTIDNTWDAPLVFGALGALTEPSLSVVADDCSEASHAAGTDCAITVRFDPVALGAVSDDLDLAYEALGSRVLSVHLAGIGLGTPEFSLAGAGGTAEEPVIDFDDVRIARTASATVIVTNTGDGPLVFGARDAVDAPFSVTADTCSANSHAPDATCEVTVRYAPTASGVGADLLRIPLDPPSDGAIEVDLTGRGNGAPVAVADTYAVVAGEVLDVESPGVLANDTDPEFDTFIPSIAVGLDGLTMAYNGSFSLPTAAADAGTALTFTYTLEDPLGSGAPATVTIEVLAPEGVDEDEDDPGACGCGTVDRGTGAWALVALAALVALRRSVRRSDRSPHEFVRQNPA